MCMVLKHLLTLCAPETGNTEVSYKNSKLVFLPLKQKLQVCATDTVNIVKTMNKVVCHWTVSIVVFKWNNKYSCVPLKQ